MERAFDFVMEKLMLPLLFLIGAGAGVALLVILFHICRDMWAPLPTFDLRVDEWTCTKYVHVSSTAFVLVGNVMLPMTTNSQRCVQWSAHE